MPASYKVWRRRQLVIMLMKSISALITQVPHLATNFNLTTTTFSASTLQGHLRLTPLICLHPPPPPFPPPLHTHFPSDWLTGRSLQAFIAPHSSSQLAALLHSARLPGHCALLHSARLPQCLMHWTAAARYIALTACLSQQLVLP